MEVSIITTYRCQMECKMCNIWKYPTDQKKEITANELLKLPMVKSTNITGGEPFLREDLEEIIRVMFQKSKRVVISTSGYHTNMILTIAKKFPKIGIRVSIEGLSKVNDYLRGKDDGFDRGLRTLLGLRKMGIKDIGFGITVSNNNSEDMLWLYELSKELKMEFATAAFHNSFYFHKYDNKITNQEEVIKNFSELINRLLKERNPKSWYRAFFNLGLINYIRGNKRILPCEAGTENFFIDPYGEVLPCNGMEEKYWYMSMGNIRECEDFMELWNSEKAKRVRELVKSCPKNCWMIGSAAPVMKKYIKYPTKWVLKNKIKSMLGKEVCIDEIPVYNNVGQKVKKEDLKE